MEADHRGPVTRGIEETAHFERSPFMQGLISGSKGALMAAPVAAVVQALRGKDPILGGIIAALGTGLAVGVAKGLTQDVKNQETESQMRYHVERMKRREPLIFLPPPQEFTRLFSKLHTAAHLRMLNRAPA